MATAKTPAADHGYIQKGLTGDKVPGFDPAAAPLETDAEAAGTAQPLDPVLPPASRAVDQPNASAHGTAMRGFSHKAEPSGLPGGFWLMLAFALVALFVVVGFELFGS